ncbi:MAG TPA: ribonuclease J [Polyangiaceae bacterium]|nr:ribonuclease J [Polyangiaceae bacterium]
MSDSRHQIDHRATLDLASPPRGNELRVVPLGGLGEIGMNCLVLEQADGALVIDCGITFPDDDVGIDIYHPDFSYLEARRGRVAGIFLTHGHEDHVGALPYLLDKIKVPVWGPPHALAVARHRLMERDLDPSRFDFITVSPRLPYEVGPFEVEPIRVAHSITDATALAVRTRAGTVVHTGDFRFDPAPPDGETTDEARLEELGSEGVRLLLSDSTNIDSLGPHVSETEVGEKLEQLVREASGRVVVGMFASNVQRLRMIGDLCRRAGRQLCLFGRSIELQVKWAHEIGRLNWPSDLVIAKDAAASFAPRKLLVLAGGTQAEAGSSMTRLAARTHPFLTLTSSDVVVFSSRIIPGNDRPVFAMIADFLRQGVTVKSWITDPTVHTSGHAHRAEQKKMLDLVRPRSFIPVHGTRHHLERHAELARTNGVGQVLVIENGQVAEVSDTNLSPLGKVGTGRVATWEGMPISGSVLKERRSLARAGIVSIALVVDGKGQVLAPPSVQGRGVIADEADPATLRFVALEIAKALNNAASSDDGALAELARLVARRAIEGKTGRKPLCLVTVTRLASR